MSGRSNIRPPPALSLHADRSLAALPDELIDAEDDDDYGGAASSSRPRPDLVPVAEALGIMSPVEMESISNAQHNNNNGNDNDNFNHYHDDGNDDAEGGGGGVSRIVSGGGDAGALLSPRDLDQLADSRITVPFVASPNDVPPKLPILSPIVRYAAAAVAAPSSLASSAAGSAANPVSFSSVPSLQRQQQRQQQGEATTSWSFGDNLIISYITWNMAGLATVHETPGRVRELFQPTGHILVYATQENGPYVGTSSVHDEWERTVLEGLNREVRITWRDHVAKSRRQEQRERRRRGPASASRSASSGGGGGGGESGGGAGGVPGNFHSTARVPMLLPHVSSGGGESSAASSGGPLTQQQRQQRQQHLLRLGGDGNTSNSAGADAIREQQPAQSFVSLDDMHSSSLVGGSVAHSSSTNRDHSSGGGGAGDAASASADGAPEAAVAMMPHQVSGGTDDSSLMIHQQQHHQREQNQTTGGGRRSSSPHLEHGDATVAGGGAQAASSTTRIFDSDAAPAIGDSSRSGGAAVFGTSSSTDANREAVGAYRSASPAAGDISPILHSNPFDSSIDAAGAGTALPTPASSASAQLGGGGGGRDDADENLNYENQQGDYDNNNNDGAADGDEGKDFYTYHKVESIGMMATHLLVVARSDVHGHIGKCNTSYVKTGALGGLLGNKGGLCVEFSLLFPRQSVAAAAASISDADEQLRHEAAQLRGSASGGVPLPLRAGGGARDGIPMRLTAHRRPVQGVNFAFVGAHLAPHEGAVQERNDNVEAILRHMGVGSLGPFPSQARPPPVGLPSSPLNTRANRDQQQQNEQQQEHQQISERQRNAADEFDFFMFGGDLNYRIDGDKAAVEKIVHHHGSLRAVLSHNDQLLKQLRTSRQLTATLRGFREGPLSFRPTYKYKTYEEMVAAGMAGDAPAAAGSGSGAAVTGDAVATTTTAGGAAASASVAAASFPSSSSSLFSLYDQGPKNRLPSYTDRILYRRHGTYRYPLHLLYYHDVRAISESDHKPVVAIVSLGTPFGAEVAKHSKMLDLVGDGSEMDSTGGGVCC